MPKEIKPKSRFAFLFEDIVSKKDKEHLFENIAMMITSGIDIIVALRVLHEETKSRGIRKIIDSIISDLENGKTIYFALSRVKLISKHLLSVVKIGELSGNLATHLEIVLEQIKKDREFKEKVRSASLYPSFVFILMIALVFVLVTFILPRLTTVYKSLQIELPWITRAMISFNAFINANGLFVLPLVMLILLLIYYFGFVHNKTKYIGQEFLLRLPVINRLYTEVEISRFGFLLGSLLKANYPILEALNLLEYSTDLRRYKLFYLDMLYSINDGLTFQQAIERFPNANKVLPAYARQLLVSAEKTGTLASSLLNIGQTYDKKNQNTIKDLTVLIEPIMLVIVWVGVAIVALAVIMPTYSLVGGINNLTSSNTQVVSDETP